MSSGNTAQDGTWKSKEQGEEATYIQAKEKAQLAALKEKLDKEDAEKKTSKSSVAADSEKAQPERDFEGGFGGQEDLEDRYATTSGEH